MAHRHPGQVTSSLHTLHQTDELSGQMMVVESQMRLIQLAAAVVVVAVVVAVVVVMVNMAESLAVEEEECIVA